MSGKKKNSRQSKKKNGSKNTKTKKSENQKPAKRAIDQHHISSADPSPGSYQIMAKPTGPLCNLGCHYCFYLEKKSFFPDDTRFRMSDEVLETYVRKYIETQKVPFVEFVFQGGEPTLMGLDFFKRAVALQKKFNPENKTITNSLQTNGTLLNDEWCGFLAENDFLVGLSMDGPEDVHDIHRIDQGGKPTFQKVYKALKLLQKHRVKYNILACVTRESARLPLKVYDFFKNEGVEFIQFIPIVERLPDPSAEALGLNLAVPPSINKEEVHREVTSWTVNPDGWGDFLIEIFDKWIRNDVGKIFVMNFEWAAASWAGMPGVVCSFAPQCGNAVIMEHNGDIYSCDHFVYPEYRLGNILKDNPKKLIESTKQVSFGRRKETSLPAFCKKCEFLFACRGECPKHRFMITPEGEPGWNYLCSGYRKYFNHINRHLKNLIHLLNQGKPAKDIMKLLKYEHSDAL